MRVPSLSGLHHLHDDVIDNPLRSIINHMTTPPIRQLFRLLLGGKANIPLSTPTLRMIPIILNSPPVTRGKWKNYSKNPSSKHHSTWDDPKKSSNRYTNSPHDSATKPLTAVSTSKSAPIRHKKSKPDTSGDDQFQFSVPTHSGHMLINLRDGSKAEWIRAVKVGLHHKDRLKAASEILFADQPTTTKQYRQHRRFLYFTRSANNRGEIQQVNRLAADTFEPTLQGSSVIYTIYGFTAGAFTPPSGEQGRLRRTYSQCGHTLAGS